MAVVKQESTSFTVGIGPVSSPGIRSLDSSGDHSGRLSGAARTFMPEISRFLGIVIAMYYRDHGPPHFHALCGGFEVTVEIESGRINGDFPPRARAHVLDWLAMHRAELVEAWSLARDSRPLPKIAPLERKA